MISSIGRLGVCQGDEIARSQAVAGGGVYGGDHTVHRGGQVDQQGILLREGELRLGGSQPRFSHSNLTRVGTVFQALPLRLCAG